jgi:hypothetical protein
MEGFVNPFRGQIPAGPEAPPERVRRFRERPFVVAFIACTFLVVAVPAIFITARPLYSSFKHWRADRLANSAQRLAWDEQWAAALNKASAAYLLVPQKARHSRLVAQSFAHFGSERALDFWQLAVAADPSCEEDRRELIATALTYHQLELAETHASELVRRYPNERANMLLAARTARAARDHIRELRTLQKAEALWPEDAEVRFLVNRALVSVGSDAEVWRALLALRQDLLRQDHVGLAALDFFLTRPAEDFPDRRRLAELLRAHPLGTAAHLISAWALEVDAAPAQRTARLAELIALVATRGPETKAAVADWLLRIGEYRLVLEMIPWDEARESPHLTLLHTDALSRTGDTTAVSRILATPGLGLRREFVHLCRWQAARAASGGAYSDREAVAAIESAASYPTSLTYLAAHFESAGRPDLAAQAFTRLRNVQKFRTIAALGLLRLARAERDTHRILRLLEQARADGAGDAAAQSEIAYHQLLLNRNIPENRQLAARLAAEHPDRVTFFVTLALACLREGDAGGAMKAFEECNFRWRRAGASMRAVYAATLAANGRQGEADEAARELSPETLLSEERELLKGVEGWATLTKR